MSNIDAPLSPPPLIPRAAPAPPPDWAQDPEGLLQSKKDSVKLALTGGIASGKSTVSTLMQAFGAKLIDFDILSRQALNPGTSGWKACLDLFGAKAKQQESEELDRSYISEKIFKSEKLRRKMEAIVHPITWQGMLAELLELKNQPLTVIDVPLLYEANLFSRFSPVALCYTSPERQLQRLMARNGIDSEKASTILKNQWPIQEKLRLADFILNNDSSIKELIRQTKELYDRLTSAYPSE
jgi:dephospho-CoA kinase